VSVCMYVSINTVQSLLKVNILSRHSANMLPL